MNLPFLQGGFLGVDGFFVLSGFLITSLLVQEWRSTGKINLPHFYARRALRLLPALFTLLLVCALYTSRFTTGALASVNWQGIFSALTYSSNWTMLVFPEHGFWSLGLLAHTWSLAVEEQFYLIWPIILISMFVGRFTKRGLITTTVLLLVGSTILRTILFIGGASTVRLYGGTDTRADALLSGCLVGLLLSLGIISPTINLQRATRLSLAVSIPALIYLCTIADDSNPMFYYGGFTLIALSVALIILQLMISPKGLLVRVLSFPGLARIGVISYGLYLWHYPVFQILATDERGWADWQTQIARIAVTFLIALISFRFIERPVLRLKQRLSEPRVSNSPISLPTVVTNPTS